MANIHSFAADYSEARDKFLAAARVAGAVTYRSDNPAKGPRVKSLSTDVAWLGPDDAARVSRDDSWTHGAEGFCGSGFQVDWLARAGRRRCRGIRTAAVRSRHQSIWLCLDAARDGRGQRPQPQLRRHMPSPIPRMRATSKSRMPGAARLSPAAFEAAESKLAAYRTKVGDVAYFRAISGGQYSHPDGFFFGGGGPSWSNRTLHAITDRFLKGRQRHLRHRFPYRPRPRWLRRADNAL